jgi:MoaA/NifB/PqqE/SkfB family radical SAM enzyme
MPVIWEMTQACDLKCKHCRANYRNQRHPLELSTAEAFHLIDQIAAMHVPIFVLTGGDPLKRPDIMPIVQYAGRRGVHTLLTPSPTRLLTRKAIFELKKSGLMRLSLSAGADKHHRVAPQRRRPRPHDRAADIAWSSSVERLLSGADRPRPDE